MTALDPLLVYELILAAYWLGYRHATWRAIRIVKEVGEEHGGVKP